LFKLAGVGIRRGKPTADVPAAPTEVLLRRAVEELFDQLPRESRKNLHEVREAVRALERTAAVLRERRDRLAATMSEAGPARDSDRQRKLLDELEASRLATEERLQGAVA